MSAIKPMWQRGSCRPNTSEQNDPPTTQAKPYVPILQGVDLRRDRARTLFSAPLRWRQTSPVQQLPQQLHALSVYHEFAGTTSHDFVHINRRSGTR